ncbi:hypothetical protein BG015_004340 [Linnemannia schmuckeri]|uniref:MICOS complex subunit n=1 Tax=Linnemannia schmuckeri TaxID=64567 RepID=A0A9P5S2K6_9FUNG|nr:hypothetical protein BG015_004340 [Linnemannia schmuckeri]
MGSTEDSYRKYKADQEPLLPGVAYAGAAAVAGSILVNRSPSRSVKILTPLALAAVTGAYFLPAHYDQLKHTWIPLKVSHSGETASSATSASLRDLKRSTEDTTLDLGHKTIDTVDDIARQTQAGWEDIKRKGENLAEAYKEAGQEHLNTAVEKSVHEAKSWLNGQRAEADRLLHETASIITGKAGSSSDHTNRFHNMPQNVKESAFYKETTAGEQPSSSRWSWWGGGSGNSSSDSEKPAISTKTETTTSSTTTQRPRRVSVDKTVASAAVKQHDIIVNRAAQMGLNAEETARKVHENVVDASMPKERQSRHEKHPIEISRRASQSDLNDGKYIVKVNPGASDDELPERVSSRMGAIKRDLHHGLQNLEKRAHMLYDGVEHLEHKLNRQIEKNLQEEADFWHEQEMKEQANARGGSGRAM